MKIAYGNSRMEKRWKNNEISWDDFCKRVSTTQTTTETVEEYRKMTKPQQDAVKDVGGFVGGHLRGGRRKTGTVLCRSMLTLDMDHGTPDILDELSLFHSHEMCVYSTHKHTPEAPRLRLIFPLKRDVSEEEYPALARKVAQEIGMDLFDDTTYQPHRLMYWPSTSSNGEYVFRVMDGDILNALLKRALGYEYEEVKEKYEGNVMTERTVTKKEVIPDTTAQIFWLKNRKPGDWRDKREPETPQLLSGWTGSLPD